MGFFLTGHILISDHYMVLSSIARVHLNQGMSVGLALLTISPSNPLLEFFLPYLETWTAADVETLVPMKRMLLSQEIQWFH